ncbi:MULTISPECIES: hypothetical protein [unclassified Tolypothrix]|uniref:hypothetical protein n=1 Tax=unclassified Tolypothrix TaxID=2649714 RepID=UPI0005F7A866|nr:MULTISPECIES: hypothetical protein [unclassified Tolypothrix]MBE9085797.1 hypothetical protein [Tolypothrix sp. LEGE 11397]UYD27042.1 hypothetical protein HGR01_02735 [Tolypothrix sp. PCC 7712]UYD37100.1 hypothetical protein HG267_16040 [Tolypothrix sp. PCC 7601]BAY93167.1 Cache sensor hybrid histidine kinase [Microchaete diplosiphon NIES-3275]
MTYPGVSIYQKLSLRLIVDVSFLIPVFAAVGFVGYFCFKNGHKAVNNLVEQLMSKVNILVNHNLNRYLATPHQIHQINADAIEVGCLNLRNFRGSGRYFCKKIQVFQEIGYNSYALTTDAGC